jgi:hypothetical protein
VTIDTDTSDTRAWIDVQIQSAHHFGYEPPLAVKLLKEYGVDYKDMLALPDEDMGQMGMCYANAWRYRHRKTGYVYVEGLAYSVMFPMWHGWCWIPRLDKCADPTWKDGKDYVGIPFKTEFVCKVQLATQEFGILDCLWQLGKHTELIDQLEDGSAIYGK